MPLNYDLLLPADGIKLQLSNVKAFIGEKDYGIGILCISENDLIWRLDNGKGLQFKYPQIGLHAISTDFNAFPHECLYMIVDKGALNSSLEEREEGEEEDSDEILPIRFVPADKTFLQPLFRAINECQMLHPDPDDEISGDDENEEDEIHDENDDDDENDFRNAEDQAEMSRAENVFLEEGHFESANVQLSEHGRQIWERLSIRHQQFQYQDLNKNGGNNNAADEASDQFQDADIADP